ncbi:MAG: DNA gyrase subunit A [Phycisphaerae bacterium]|jgi:DNA gyrase subunit A|nr:DNA gyrase subunit A [Phycisphaerae bacterium]
MAEEIIEQQNIQDRLLDEEMRESYLTYAMSVIMSRALPDVRDGLKPSQRRILVAMRDLNLGPRTKSTKCAGIVGETMKKYHPHGDQAIYPTLVRMAQSFNIRYTLIDGQGNFGSIDGDPAAAMRYTEARLTAASVEMMEDIQYQTVDFQPNYDETIQEPKVLPGKFPNLLVNGSTGIAVGMATNIPPHNLNEICDGLIKLIDHPEATIEELCEIIRGPDFPTGGIICGRASILQGYKTGRGSVIVRGKLHTEEQKNGKTLIVVDEIPYQILKTTIVERIADCVKQGTIADIADVRDESDRKGMRLVVELKRDGNVDLVINQLYKYTPLQDTIPIINIALVNQQPRTLSLREMLMAYLTHRKEVIRRRTQFLLKRARQRSHIVEGLLLAVADIDEIIKLIRNSPDPATAKQRLMAKSLRLTESETLRKLLPEKFVDRMTSSDQFLTEPQADAILAMQLQRLTGLELEKLADEFKKLGDQIEGFEAILNDEKLVMDIIREDLYEMKDKYGDKRRTEISDEEIRSFNMEDLIAEEEVAVTISHEGYIKRVSLTVYRTQGRGGRGVRATDNKEGDWLEHLFIASTHDYLLFFTTRGRVLWLRVFDIPSMSRTSKGRAIVNLLELSREEKITSVLSVREFTSDQYIIMCTKAGVIKKTSLDAFSHPRSAGIIAISLDESDTLINVELTHGTNDIILATQDGMAIRFSEEDVRPMGRTARGVKGITLRSGDEVVDMAVVDPQGDVLTVCENGYGKRTPIEDYRKQTRGGIGIINIKASDRNGRVVGAKSVNDKDQLMLITRNGIVIRFSLKDIRPIGRNTQGVRMIKVEDGDSLMAIAKVVPEEEEEVKS